MMASPFGAQQGAAAVGPRDYNKLFKAEPENLEFAEGIYTWSGSGVENRVLRRYGKLAPQ
jgi:hypothetical protein